MIDINILPLPMLISLAVSAAIFFVSMYGHLSFKLIPIHVVRLISVSIAGISGFIYFSNMYVAVIDHDISITKIHMGFIGSVFILVILVGIISREIRPTILQICGLAMFVMGMYFILA